VPIGSGKFVFSKDGDSLIPNPKHYDASLKISKIKLINAPDSESMQHYVEIGATDIYYAQMWDDTIIRMSGKKTDVNLNNLIYLGINHNYAPLKSADIRYAISSAVSRSTLATRAFNTNAVPATGFFHPDWKEVSDFQTIQPTADLKISVENLANIGYNRLNEDGYYENMHGNILEFTLLVNSDSATKLAAAQLIADQLKSAGIKITLVPLSKDAYFSALKAGQFQLYLGEIKLLPNMDMRSLVAAGGKAAYGIVNATQPTVTEDQTENTTAEEYFDSETSYAQVVKGFYKGENTIADVASSLLASMPVIPLLYRSSILFYAGDIEDVASPSCYDIFFSIDNYKFKQ
jgi:peptide/nickel transport system substrate-binding protein